jgi:hypothetical protein
MQKWADRAPAELKKAIAVAEPANRFELQLGRVAVAYEFEMRNLPDGKVTSARIAVEDHALRAKEALETAAAAGLDKDAAFRLVTLAFAASGDARQALDWFDQQRAGQPMDDLLAEIVRKQAYSPSSEQTFQWAARISDAELRGSLSRGAFRMYMLSRPPAAIDKFFAETPLPAAMAAELQALRKENGR